MSVLLGLAELAMEKTPESAWLAGESLLLFVSRGDSARNKSEFESLLLFVSRGDSARNKREFLTHRNFFFVCLKNG